MDIAHYTKLSNTIYTTLKFLLIIFVFNERLKNNEKDVRGYDNWN